MMVKSALKVSALTFVLALKGRIALNYFYEIREDQIAKQACSLVSRQLETGSLRETYEQLQYGLAANGYKQACVTVTDNGRSYTHECTQNNQSSRSLLCKAEANSGVRATMAFPQHPIFNRGFLNLLLL